MSASPVDINSIPNVRRIENFPKEEMNAFCLDLTHAVYPHDEIFGKYCTLEEHIECPPEDVFRYLANALTLQEWTYSMRDFVPAGTTEWCSRPTRSAARPTSTRASSRTPGR
jgi:hypothetical protein